MRWASVGKRTTATLSILASLAAVSPSIYAQRLGPSSYTSTGSSRAGRLSATKETPPSARLRLQRLAKEKAALPDEEAQEKTHSTSEPTNGSLDHLTDSLGTSAGSNAKRSLTPDTLSLIQAYERRAKKATTKQRKAAQQSQLETAAALMAMDSRSGVVRPHRHRDAPYHLSDWDTPQLPPQTVDRLTVFPGKSSTAERYSDRSNPFRSTWRQEMSSSPKAESGARSSSRRSSLSDLIDEQPEESTPPARPKQDSRPLPFEN